MIVTNFEICYFVFKELMKNIHLNLVDNCIMFLFEMQVPSHFIEDSVMNPRYDTISIYGIINHYVIGIM